MKQRHINATLKRALPPIAALGLTALLIILTPLPQTGATAPTVASLSTNPKRINESAAAHSFIRSPFVDSTPGTSRISAAPRLERQPLESLTSLNSTDLEAEAAATERGAPSAAPMVQAADAENVELVGQIGGITEAVAVQGDYAYLGVGSRLVVLDVSNPANPMVVGQTGVLPDVVQDVAVAGDYAYVADDDAGLRIIDVTDPATPIETGVYDTPEKAFGVAVAGDYAYVGDGYGGLRIIDVTDPAAPTEAGFYDTPGDARGVAVAAGDPQGHTYAYVVDWDEGLRIINVTDPAAPTEAGFYDTVGRAGGVAVVGDYAYVATKYYDGGGGGLHIINVTDPAAPSQVGFYDTPGQAYGVAVAGDYAYVADWDEGLRIINVTDPAAPTETGFYDTPGFAYGVAVAGNYAYVADEWGGLVILRFTGGEATYYVPDDYPTIQAAVDAASPGDTIIVRDGTYTENVDVNKSVTIESENGAEATIVQAANPDDHVFEVTADYVSISGFTVRDATEEANAGILCESETCYCNILGNVVVNNYYGIRLEGNQDSHSIISNNSCSSNSYGILVYSNRNEILSNNCTSNHYGIGLIYSKYNTLKGNVMVSNGIRIYGYNSLAEFDTHEIDTSNTVNGKPVYYWVNVQGGSVPEGAGQVILANCTDIVVENQQIHNASIGVAIAYSTNITVTNNDVSLNRCGVKLVESSFNSISSNDCSNNRFGVDLRYSMGNKIVHNDFSSDTYGVYCWVASGECYLNNFISNERNVDG